MNNLTPKKKKILDYLEAYFQEHQYYPTLMEIAKKIKVSSVATVHQHMSELQKMGLIKRAENKPRDLQINMERPLQETGSMIELPIAGLITAGAPIEAIEDKSESIAVPKELISNPNSYILKVKGDSMVESLIADGDYVVVEKRDYANNGDIVVALLEDGTATLKEFHREKKYIRLQPRNRNYKPLLVKNVVIQGKVAGIIRKF
ncbi:MAG: transcriptional repressor LexA [Patescibacteria group bacterium]|jgi:repressor LexA